MKNNAQWILICLIFCWTGCTSHYYDDCSVGPNPCQDELVIDLRTSDTNHFPLKIRQGMTFKNDSSIIICYTKGIDSSTQSMILGMKRVEERCGEAKCNYYLKYHAKYISYYSLSKDFVFEIRSSFGIYPDVTSLATNKFEKREFTSINVLRRIFYLPSNQFNVNDSNGAVFNATINLNGIDYKNVYCLSVDSINTDTTIPYLCYYSADNDGLIGFRIKNAGTYFIIN